MEKTNDLESLIPEIEKPLYNFATPWKVCDLCAHFHGDYKVPFLGCAAFPDGIPDEFMEQLYREGGHDKPLKGDNGIRFSPRE